jgi:hypothetical protein
MDSVVAVAYSPTASAVQTVICALNVQLAFILTMEFARLAAYCVLNAAMPLFVQNVDLVIHS